MREIKFRAWDTVSKVWCNPSKVIGVDNDGMVYPVRDLEKDIELMQYTGLKDKNGKEIYEGDILQSEYMSVSPRTKNNCHPVVWSGGHWTVDHSINDCCKPWRGDLSGHHISEEIIGNMYENPELLNEDKK